MNAKVARIGGIGCMLMSAFSFSGCLKTEEFPDEPNLTYKSLEQRFATLQGGTQPSRFIDIRVDFTDGDGDIGLDEGDTQSPFGQGEAHYYNYSVEFRRLSAGVWTDIDSDWSYRIKRISPSGQDPTLNGEILVEVGPFPGPRPFPLSDILVGDTLQAYIRLEDRALNASNTVSSGAFVMR